MLFPGGKFTAMWKWLRVDSREVSLTDKAAIEEKLSFYGPESNYARSHVYGMFPLATATQLIPVDVVEAAAVRRDALAHSADAVIIGVDVASGHGTDVSVAAVRKGLDARTYGQHKFPGVDTMGLAYAVAARLQIRLGPMGFLSTPPAWVTAPRPDYANSVCRSIQFTSARGRTIRTATSVAQISEPNCGPRWRGG